MHYYNYFKRPDNKNYIYTLETIIYISLLFEKKNTNNVNLQKPVYNNRFKMAYNLKTILYDKPVYCTNIKCISTKNYK